MMIIIIILLGGAIPLFQSPDHIILTREANQTNAYCSRNRIHVGENNHRARKQEPRTCNHRMGTHHGEKVSFNGERE